MLHELERESKLKWPRVKLDRTYQVNSASGHCMYISEGIDACLTLTSDSGHKLSFNRVLCIIPGSHKQPVNICHNTLDDMGIIKFAENLNRIAASNPSPFSHGIQSLNLVIQPVDYINVAAEHQAQFRKTLHDHLGDYKVPLKPDRFIDGSQSSDFYLRLRRLHLFR
jgi:hypothetical protein